MTGRKGFDPDKPRGVTPTSRRLHGERQLVDEWLAYGGREKSTDEARFWILGLIAAGSILVPGYPAGDPLQNAMRILGPYTKKDAT